MRRTVPVTGGVCALMILNSDWSFFIMATRSRNSSRLALANSAGPSFSRTS